MPVPDCDPVMSQQLQTIAFLSHLRTKKIYGPFLVVAPLSTLPNWVNEFKRWCPEQPVILYHGSKPERAELRRNQLSGAVHNTLFPVYTFPFSDRFCRGTESPASMG